MRLIDAEKLWLTTEYVDGKEHKYYEQFEVDNAPTIEAKPVKHGKWDIFHNDSIPFAFKCSACGQLIIVATKYCANCGAKMDSNDSNALNALSALEMASEVET